MTNFWRAVLTILWKDILLEVRAKETITPVLVFAFLVVIIFNFAFEPTPLLVVTVAPGILWVAFTFAGVLGLSRSFAVEKDKGSLDGLMLAPVGREAIYFGKLLGSFLFMLVVELLMLPPFLVLFNVPLFEPEFLITAMVATLGFAAVGTVFSAMSVNTRAREIMLPVLFFPIVLPVIIGAVAASGPILEEGSWSDIAGWLQFMVAFDAIFLVVSSLTFQFVLEE
ncbi:MAG: heme exporter protein CcmB [Chloroflexi bacterium]|nr:heme exporter protein CcmB [Chloroflexota bacterium]